MAKIYDVFKIPIYETHLDLDNKKLLDWCLDHEQKNEANDFPKSNKGGYQSENLLFLNDNFLNPLINELEKHATLFSFQKNKQRVINMWFNINRYKDYNSEHTHPFSVYSGSYYIKTPKNSGSLNFLHPSYDILGWWSNISDEHSSSYYHTNNWIEPQEGTLVLFPSWLHHRVLANENKTEERVSVAFNTQSILQMQRMRDTIDTRMGILK